MPLKPIFVRSNKYLNIHGSPRLTLVFFILIIYLYDRMSLLILTHEGIVLGEIKVVETNCLWIFLISRTNNVVI